MAGKQMPVHVNTPADSQQLIMHFLGLKDIRNRLGCQHHFFKKLRPEVRFQIEQFRRVMFAYQHRVAANILIVPQDDIPGRQFRDQVRILPALC